MPPYNLPRLLLCAVGVLCIVTNHGGAQTQGIMHVEDTTDVIDHASFDSLWHASLRNGRLNTDAVHGSAYQIYQRRLETATPKAFLPAARCAFWCNAWLAAVLKVMSAHAGYRSTIWTADLFDADTFTIAGEPFTLRTLRRRMVIEARSPLAVFALATGSTRAPPFPASAYRAKTVARALRDMAKRVCRSERFVLYDPGSNLLQVSSMFAEFEPLILASFPSIVQFLLPYVQEAVAAELALRRETLRVVYADAVERWIRRR